jgi:C4-dicarboxylate transporter DctQ subunit
MARERRGLRAWLATFELRALELALLALVVLNAANVLARYVFHRPIGASFELMILLAIAVYWIGIGTAERYSGHLGVSFVVARLPAGVRRVTDGLRLAVICGFLAATAFAGARLALSQFESGAVSGALNLPLWIFVASVPAGAMLMLVRVLRPRPARTAGETERQLL